MKKKIFYFSVIFSFVLLLILINNLNTNKNKKKDKIIQLENKLMDKENLVNNLIKKKIKQDQVLTEVGKNIDFIPFFKNKEIKQFKFNDSDILFEKFETSFLKIGKNKVASSSSYLDYHANNLIFASGDGIFAYVDIEKLNRKKFILAKIKNNFKKFIDYDEFYKKSKFGIKDILIDDNKLFVTFSYQLKKNCFNISVAYADINYEFLNFEKYFFPNECVSVDNEYGEFNAHHSGGRIIRFKDKYLLSIGEFKFRDHAQNLNNIFGKVIQISKKNNYKVFANGLRNPQGLFYDYDNDLLLISDHGPKGGDELNFQFISEKKVNFGWPLSSYGEHYGFKIRDNNAQEYKKAPLRKSHKKYGFKEPMKYFNPAIGPSEVIKIPKKFFHSNVSDKDIVILSSMGWGNDSSSIMKNGGMSLHFFEIDENIKIQNHSIFNIGERIRDLKYIPSKNLLLLFLENSPAIGVLRVN